MAEEQMLAKETASTTCLRRKLLCIWIGHGENDAVNDYCTQRIFFGFFQVSFVWYSWLIKVTL